MSDFTKSELQDLYTLINYAKTQMYLVPHISIGLYQKLISMIENYCEHERCGLGECNNYPEECLRCNKKCNKCGEWHK